MSERKDNARSYGQNRNQRPQQRYQKPKRIVSAGFIVRSKDGKYLIGRTTKYPKDQCWTVFKGQQEYGESLIATATRELREEAGIDILRSVPLQLSQSTSPFYSFSMKDKDVILYLLNDETGALDDAKFRCSSDWGPDGDKVPEICEYKWCTLDEMEKLVFPSQRGLVTHLRESRLESS
jgi:8-oxo-dGTP pyrophosphatase MutT (NUDIX family)